MTARVKTLRFTAVLGVAGLCLAAFLGAGTTAAEPAQAVIAPAAISGHADDAVSAKPPATRPSSKACTITLADHVLSNAEDGSPQEYSGTLEPPAACPGPWSKVVLDSTTSVSGRQFDRSGELVVGDVPIWYGTTQEPDGEEPTSFSFSKDVTRYSSLFTSARPFHGGYFNYTDDTYTGVYDQTVTLTFFTADAANPAADVPDAVVPVAVPDLDPDAASAEVPVDGLPRNITNAALELTLKGNGCDEQWFTAVPDEVAESFGEDSFACGSGSYREAAVSVDGTPAGAVGTFPHIYSGGIAPALWRPVVAIDTLDLRPETLDLTPFAGSLVDGEAHSLGVSMDGIGDVWNVRGALFLETDPGADRTSGALTAADVSTTPTVTETHEATGTSDEQAYTVAGAREDTLTGYVDTSAGRITTTTTYRRDFEQQGTISTGGTVQSVDHTDTVAQTSRSTDAHGATVRSNTLDETYPISVDATFSGFLDDTSDSFEITGSVDESQRVRLVSTGEGARLAPDGEWDWHLVSDGVMAREDGVTSEFDGTATTTYVGTDDAGRARDVYIHAEHGKVVESRGLDLADPTPTSTPAPTPTATPTTTPTTTPPTTSPASSPTRSSNPDAGELANTGSTTGAAPGMIAAAVAVVLGGAGLLAFARGRRLR